ncbi:MAG: hypothetical protein ACI4JG_02175 [Acutalibacteraceae bacterium]
MGIAKNDEHFVPEYNCDNNTHGIIISDYYVDDLHLISDRDIKKINKEIGVDDFICVPRECGGGGFPEDVFIDIAIGIMSGVATEGLTYAFKKIFSKIKKKKKSEDGSKGNIVFRAGNPEGKFFFSFKANLDGNEEQIDGLLEKAIKIAEIINESDSE